MARKAKETKPVSLRMEKATVDRLTAYCEESGQSKTVAMERAINMYIDDYENKKSVIEKTEQNEK